MIPGPPRIQLITRTVNILPQSGLLMKPGTRRILGPIHQSNPPGVASIKRNGTSPLTVNPITRSLPTVMPLGQTATFLLAIARLQLY